MRSPFDGPAPHLFTIPAGEDFLGCLSKTLIEVTGARTRPDALADALIYVPNRRSARVLAYELYKHVGQAGFLPPEIRPLGDLDSDGDVVSTEAALAGLGPAPSPSLRLGALAAMVSKWYEVRGQDLPPASVLAAAQDLARLLDQAALAQSVDWADLETLTEGTDLAAHWEISLDFLKIVTQQWPDFLAENGLSEPFERRARVADALAYQWRTRPPAGPVIIAGSTGTTPASRILMQAAAQLEQGAVVFPGLETGVTDSAWTAIGNAPSHPQYAFFDTLKAFAVTPADVRIWPGADSDFNLERRRLIAEALAPADETADWIARLDGLAGEAGRVAFVRKGLSGLSLLEADDEADEARQAALLLRETLEHDGQTAALVTPNAALARRVSALLERWGVRVSPSAGQPLLQTGAGSFVALVLDWLMDTGNPVKLAAMVKHQLFQLGRSHEACLSDWTIIERGSLRGPVRWSDFDGVVTRVLKDAEAIASGDRRSEVSADALNTAAGLLIRIQTTSDATTTDLRAMGAASGRTYAEAVAALAMAFATGEDGDDTALWAGRDGAETALFLEAFADTCDLLGPIAREAVPDMFRQFAIGRMVPGDPGSHPRLNIWGPLEARLQSCDRLILGGLNEGQWPERPTEDGFLPRHYRRRLGLPDLEARVGLSAHDFAQLASGPDVVLLRSKRADNAPAVASRWLWRLQTLVGGALSDAEAKAALSFDGGFDPQTISHALDIVPPAAPIAPPQPRPGAEIRPRRLSVTQITNLIRDPYSIYARYVLGLQPLGDLGADFGPSEIGTAIHAALEQFETCTDQTVEALLGEIARQFESAGLSVAVQLAREPLDRRAAQTYLDWRAARSPEVKSRIFETPGKLSVSLDPGTEVILSGRVDCLDVRTDGTVAVVDFKTGAAKTDAQVISGLEPQLPLMAAMARSGGFKDVPGIEPSELIYFEFRASGGAKPIKRQGPDGLVDATLEGVRDLLVKFADPHTPYLSKPRVQFLTEYGDYDRLARRAEWTSETGEGE